MTTPPVVRLRLASNLPPNVEFQSGNVHYEAIVTNNHQALAHLVPKELLNQRTLLTQETLHRYNNLVFVRLAIFSCEIHLLKPGLAQADRDFINDQSTRLQALETTLIGGGNLTVAEAQFIPAFTAPNAFIEWKQALLGAAGIVQVLRGTAG